jgi:S-adenosylmethionine-diacylgycerolhomoserine-N-methlytransferase
MLHGRLPMVTVMPAPRGGTWVDLGGGTGSNLEFFGDKLNHWGKVVVLDFCPSLVETAKKRIASHPGWSEFCSVILGDACDMNQPELPAAGTVDVVTFSYALTMIPDWRGAIRNAYRLLKPVSFLFCADVDVVWY